MKNLKITHKLWIGIIGQLVFIFLLLYFIINLNNKLNEVTDNKIESTQEINHYRGLAGNIKDYLVDNLTFRELQDEYNELINQEDESSHRDKLQTIWAKLESIDKLKKTNIEINKNVSSLLSESIKQSNLYIENTSSRLADPNEKNRVSVIERLVIIGANTNTNNQYIIKDLFLRMNNDITVKEELINFLDKGIAQANEDVEKLKNTPFAQLPINALNANKQIKEYTLEFVNNLEKINKTSDEAILDVNNLVAELNQNDIDSALKSFSDLKATFRNIFIVLLIISVLIAALNTSVSKLVGYVLKQLSIDLTEMSEGNLVIAQTEKYRRRKDEVGVLAISFDKLISNLKSIVNNIMTGADNVASASQQISSATQQLSQGATEQASSAEEVSSSMEEMASNIQQNTDNAQQTETIAIKAAEGISQVSGAAEESLTSIRQIAEKITIVNDIAFQTNILALNAAVEAARAGEHGKGFAVVAAEVRKLAERSKVAADEINELSGKSLKVTEDAGKLMAEIIPEIEKTSKLVQEISAASLEQNSGANQVNSAIQQLNQVTQQNATTGEEMATNSEELASQAEQLKQIVSFFKTDETKSTTLKPNKNKVQHKEQTSKRTESADKKDKVEIKSKGYELDLLDNNKLDSEFESF